MARYNQPETVNDIDWVYLISPALIAAVSMPVQIFLAWRLVSLHPVISRPLSCLTLSNRRVYTISKAKWLLGLTWGLTAVQGFAAIGTSVGAFVLHE